MTPQDNHRATYGAKQRNKFTTYGKGLRNTGPTYDVFSTPVVLDSDEDTPRPVKKKTTSLIRTSGAGARKGLVRKADTRFSPVQAVVPESKSVFDLPSSDSEDNGYARSRANSKKRKLEHHITNTFQDGVYDDESLQRHIAAEAQRDQENLQSYSRPKNTLKSQSGITAVKKAVVHEAKVDLGAQRSKLKASVTSNATTKTIKTPADMVIAKTTKKRQTLSARTKSVAPLPTSQSFPGRGNGPEVLPIPPTPVLRNASLARKVSTVPGEAPGLNKNFTTDSSTRLQTFPSLQSTSNPPTLKDESSQTKKAAKGLSLAPDIIVRNSTESNKPTMRVNPQQLSEKLYDSPSKLGVQSIQLSSPGAPPTVRKIDFLSAVLDPAERSKSISAPVRPRKRIIDRLFGHSSCSSLQSDEEEEEDRNGDSGGADTQSSASSPSQPLSKNTFAGKVTADEVMLENDQDTQQTTKSSQSTYGGARVTYQHQRSYLTEEMVDEADLFKIPILPGPVVEKSSRRSKATRKAPGLPGLPSLQPSFDIEEDFDDVAAGHTRNIHELRQAGGNARLLGSMEAILDDIGPNKGVSLSARRNGLLDLCRTLMQPVSCQAFIDHGLVDQLFAQFDASLDAVAGILVMSCFAFVLSQQCPMHLLTLINDARVLGFLGSRLQSIESFKGVVGKRISNLSRVMQQELLQFSDSLLASPIWSDSSPLCLTAGALSLHCLEGAVRHLREAGCTVDVLSQQLVSSLVGIAAPAVNTLRTSSDLVSHIGSIEFRQSISILEYTTTISPTTETHETAWTSDSIEQTAQLLPMLCNQAGDQLGKAQLLVLRLCLNLTNRSGSPCEIFSTPDTVHAAVVIVLSGFRGLSEEEDAEVYAIVLDNVVLALGLLINLAESSDVARLLFLTESQGNRTPLDALLQLFHSNVAKASEVVSERDTQSNVAFGYLSVLLAHLSLSRPLRERVQSQMQGATLKPLLNAVGEFLEYNRRVTDQIIQQGEQEVDLKAGFLGRLQELLEQLHAA